MALNPFFLQGSPGEQRLVQDLIDEHLKIFGIEIIYIPRKFVRKQTIIKEIQSSKFDDNFAIEAYVNSYEGYTGSGDILTKFGMSLRDDVSLIISRERFEDFISPFLNSEDPEVELASRPREGDLIYFPLGQRLFEVKFVENEKPFYQLGKLYVYELQCELFEYEDEVLDTTIDEIDRTLETQGYITSLKLSSYGSIATADCTLTEGYVRKIYLENDGYGYTSIPTVSISTAPSGGINASAVAITTTIGKVKSIQKILLSNCGAGYTTPPTITIIGGGGSGAIATCQIETVYKGIGRISIANSGVGYILPPTIHISNPSAGPGIAASAISFVNQYNNLSNILISDAGVGFTTTPNITLDQPTAITGIGTFKFNEIVTGSKSGATARVKSWDNDTKILEISINSGQFIAGENVLGSKSSAIYTVSEYNTTALHDKYEENEEIEKEADTIIDFSESNPFGIY